MKLHDTEIYADDEKNTIERINDLFIEWKEYAVNLNGNSAGVLFEEKVVVDGFYPYYTKQKKKILFIGRESLNIEGSNYIQTLYDCYKKGEIGGKPINSTSFHALMFYITYAINNDVYEWGKIPSANTLTESFATDNGISFAFMNLSKLSNSTGDWQADWKQIDYFLNNYSTLMNINFINKQIELINPDIIITMNFGNYIKYLGNNRIISKSTEINEYQIEAGNSLIQLFDMYHFSAPGKSSKDDYFYPLINLYSKER